MTKSQHTPGPWLTLQKNGHWNIIGGTHGRVTDIDSSYAKQGEIDANARLIAAAPELLEALKFACDVLEFQAHVNGDTGDYMDAIKESRAAIIKATEAL